MEILAAQSKDPDRVLRGAHARTYPNYVWFCVSSFIGFISICHFSSLVYRALWKRPTRPYPHRRDVILYKRLPVATLNAFRAIAFRWSVPSPTYLAGSYSLNLAEVFVAAAYTVVLFVWALVNSTSKAGVKYDPRYWANVAGNIAASQLPLLTALGTKNNIISLLTGISFERLNYLHRIAARVLCVLIWIHGAGRFRIGLRNKTSLANAWMQCGVLGATTLTVLCVVSLRPLRERQYEMFLAIHFALVLIFLLASYFHAQNDVISYGHYVWPSFLIWGLDRFIRLVRIIAFNFSRSPGNPVEDAHVEMLSPLILRITLRRPAHWYIRWRPGQSAYLSVPHISKRRFGWAHPFTISTIRDCSHPQRGCTTKDSQDRDGIDTKASEYVRLTFLVRVREGFTKRLMRAVPDGSNKGMNTKVIMDGPYSSPPILRGYATVVLVAGGSGVAFTLPLLLDVISHAKQRESGRIRVVFIWAIRDASHINWILDDLLSALQDVPQESEVVIRIFVTASRPKECSPIRNEPVEGDQDVEKMLGEVEVRDNRSPTDRTIVGQLLDIPGLELQEGRPDLKKILEGEIELARGDVSVNACGPQELTRDVKVALRPIRFLHVLRGGPSVNLHVENFGN